MDLFQFLGEPYTSLSFKCTCDRILLEFINSNIIFYLHKEKNAKHFKYYVAPKGFLLREPQSAGASELF